MAGISVGGGGGKRRSMDVEVSTLPMIDLMMVLIAFLLVTAVWTTMSRVDADAKVPGPQEDVPPCMLGSCGPEKELHLDARSPDAFVLEWRMGETLVKSATVPRRTSPTDSPLRYPELQAALEKEWAADGVHRDPRDPVRDRVVLQTANGARYEEIVAEMDAVYGVSRGSRGAKAPAFAVTFAVR
jgi:Biopolymer transport protein ExbD/TolR